MPNPDRPYMSQAEAKEFTKLYNDLNKKIASVLLSATTLAEAEDGRECLRGLLVMISQRPRPCMGLPFLWWASPGTI